MKMKLLATSLVLVLLSACSGQDQEPYNRDRFDLHSFTTDLGVNCVGLIGPSRVHIREALSCDWVDYHKRLNDCEEEYLAERTTPSGVVFPAKKDYCKTKLEHKRKVKVNTVVL
jgi:hypothetical protein